MKNIWDCIRQKYQDTLQVKHVHLQALRKESKVLHTNEEKKKNL